MFKIFDEPSLWMYPECVQIMNVRERVWRDTSVMSLKFVEIWIWNLDFVVEICPPHCNVFKGEKIEQVQMKHIFHS